MGKDKTRIVRITKEPVELYKILKFENMAASGGEAKYFIVDGLVTVNEKIETRKRRKIYSGDVIGFDGIFLKIQTQPDETEPDQIESNKIEPDKKGHE
jgi:ribosome-associated protein